MDLKEPLVHAVTIPLDVELALSGQGVPPDVRPTGQVLAAARRAVDEAADLFAPRFVRVVSPVLGVSPSAVVLTSASLHGEAVARALEGSDRVIAVICTIGPAVDRRISSLLAIDPLLALALDGLGSAACERLAETICADIEREAAGEGNRVTGRLSPGMIGWPLCEGQDQLFGLVDPAPIGVTLAPSGQMIPRKSQSFVVGVGARVRRQSQCATCGAAPRCRFRWTHA